jgi:hypothetical protein
LTNTKFADLNQNELLNIDGGGIDWKKVAAIGAAVVCFPTIIVLTPIVSTTASVAAVAYVVKKDLENCYNNGYNEVYNGR